MWDIDSNVESIIVICNVSDVGSFATHSYAKSNLHVSQSYRNGTMIISTSYHKYHNRGPFVKRFIFPRTQVQVMKTRNMINKAINGHFNTVD